MIILKVISLVILISIELVLMCGYINEIKENIADSSTSLVVLVIFALSIPLLYITMT